MDRGLGEKRAVSLDLTNLAEQELLLGCLYNRHVKFVRGKRFEESLDSELTNIKGAGAGETWHQRLRAPDHVEPLACLIELDEQRRDQAAPRCAGFSEFSAYLALLSRFDSSVEKLAAHLAISLSALRRRIERARDRANVQPTLFDFESTDGNFITRSAWFRRLRIGWHARKAAWVYSRA